MCFIVKIWGGIQICLERVSCLSDKGVVNYLSKIKTLYISRYCVILVVLDIDNMQVNPC